MSDLEMPGLTDTLQRKLDWLRETNGVKSAQVKLDEYELTYVLSCIRYYMSDMAMRRAEKLPLVE